MAETIKNKRGIQETRYAKSAGEKGTSMSSTTVHSWVELDAGIGVVLVAREEGVVEARPTISTYVLLIDARIFANTS